MNLKYPSFMPFADTFDVLQTKETQHLHTSFSQERLLQKLWYRGLFVQMEDVVYARKNFPSKEQFT